MMYELLRFFKSLSPLWFQYSLLTLRIKNLAHQFYSFFIFKSIMEDFSGNNLSLLKLVVSVMAMRKVNFELVCHFKEKLLLRVVLSLEFHVESNLNAM